MNKQRVTLLLPKPLAFVALPQGGNGREGRAARGGVPKAKAGSCAPRPAPRALRAAPAPHAQGLWGRSWSKVYMPSS